jgi:hypothetical protein
MTLFVSSYSASFAPGTFFMHSGDSAKASSALQALETRIPDHAPELGGEIVAEFVAESLGLPCPANATGTIEMTATKKRKKRFALESALADGINGRPLFHS